jgi:AbrB family looped-hinge helix DNA binding protein
MQPHTKQAERKLKRRRQHFVRATGIVRRIDELGRVVIPKEIRRTLRIREGDPQLTVLERESDTQMLLALLAGVIEQRRKYT